MKLDAGEIDDLVEETERKRAGWAQAAQVWEKDWSLVRYDDSPNDIKELDGVSVVVSPDPYNIIQLLMRFVADEVRVEIPSISTKDDDEDRAEEIEEFLVAFEHESGRQQGRNLIQDKTWFSGVRGRGASQTIWVADVLPKGLKDERLPILKRNLDPFNVGVARGPYWTDHAYHKYEASRADIEQRYPKHKLKEQGSNVQGRWNQKYTVVDFWSRHEGVPWHGVTIDGEFAKNMVATDYPDIPIIEWYADGAPLEDELARSLSILHPIHELWKLKCNLMSKIATGLDYHYDPMIVTKGFGEQRVKAGPGEVVNLEANQSIDAFRAEPNVPMAEKMLALIQTGIDQATFPSVTYGEGPGGVTAGFAINSLAQAARSRANVIRGNIEAAMEAENQLVLGLIEAFSPDEGVQIYGRSSRGDRGKPIHLAAKQIKGNYANRVMLVPEQPMDDNARIMAWLQMTEKGVTSMSLMRNRVVNVAMPRDEETRIALEQALKSPEMQAKVQLRALQKSFNQADWERMIQGTPLQQVHEAEMQWQEQKDAEKAAAQEARRVEKQQREQEAMMASMPPMMPPSMMGDPMQMPPGLEGMSGPTSMGGMPPGGGPEGMQPQGAQGISGPMMGQFSPQSLGVPPGGPPGQFDQMMGNEPSEQDILNQLIGGGQPPMMA